MLYIKIQMDNIRPERYFVQTSMEINPKLGTFVGKSWGRGIILTGRELECRMVGRTMEAVEVVLGLKEHEDQKALMCDWHFAQAPVFSSRN